MPGTISIRIERTPDGRYLQAAVILRQPGRQNRRYVVRADLVRMHELLSVRALDPAAAGVGFGLGDIVKAAKKLARSKVLARALTVARGLSRGPLGAVLPPGTAALIDGAYRARKLVVQARRGDKAAQQRIAQARANVPRDPRIAQSFAMAHQLFAGL
jgi:hypothetical protein